MKARINLPLFAVVLITFTAISLRADDPRTNSWLTAYSGKYARIYTTDANKTAGTMATTWSSGTLSQTSPAYCGVQEVYSSANWVYIRSTGLGSHIMGPWYLDLNHTQIFPNFPINTKTLYRIPRAPTTNSTHTLTGLGAIGYFVDGIAMFDSRDSFYWNGTSEVGGAGTGYWNRDAYVNESPSFDPGNAHQPQDGMHHYHANPVALRYQLNDHVAFNSTNKTYSESSSTNLQHSPLLGWVSDGYPIYGAYAYSNALDQNSPVIRMRSGFQLRNGQKGTQNLTSVGRTNIPLWAVRVYATTANKTGPNVSTSYPLGRYMEDNDYLGDLGYKQGTDYDLDEYNGRWCVTPEFPNGTYAYFVSISSNGAPAFPYNIGRAFYANPTGGKVTSISETVVTNFLGGPNTPLQLNPPSVSGSNYTVTLTWSSVEGGTYQVGSSTDESTWNSKIGSVPSQGTSTATNYTGGGGVEYARVTRTALASFDTAGLAATVSQQATQSYTIIVTNRPAISMQPMAQAVTAGSNVTFSVVASGATPLTYQWQKDGAELAGKTSSSLYLNPASGTDGGGYSVIVSNNYGAATSSVVALTVNADVSDPTAAILSPAANSVFTSGGITLSGTATDNARVSQVLVSVNGGAVSNATVTLGANASTATWSIPSNFSAGNNTVSVQSVDFSGNTSATTTRSFFFKSFTPLAIVVNGSGTAVSKSGLSLVVGSNYTVTASAMSGNLFSNWNNSVSGYTTTASQYTFTMASNLTLTATFTPNQSPAAAGVYYGLFSDGTNISHATAGFFRVSTTSTRTFSGYLYVDGDRLSFAGTFNVSGHGSNTKQITRTGKSTLGISFQLPFDSSDTITGTVSSADDGWTSSLNGNRSPFSAANPASSLTGKYTMLLPGFADGAVGPAGDGSAYVSVSTGGSPTAAGWLGDGYALAPMTAKLSKNGDWPFYVRAYKSGTAYKGSLQGWAHFTNNTVNSIVTGELTWNKAGWTNGYYDSGFSGTMDALGSVYLKAIAPATRSLNMASGTVKFSQGNLTGSLTDTVAISDKNAITFTTKTSGGKLTYANSTGRITGTFTNSVTGKTLSVKGIYLQGTGLNYIGGYFLGTGQSGEARLE